MYAQVEKPKENKSRTVTNTIAQKKSNLKQGFGFADERPKAVAQRKYLKVLNSDQDSQTVQLSTKLHTSGCRCPSCSGTMQLNGGAPKKSASQNKDERNSAVVSQLCQHGHPEHAHISECPYGLKHKDFRIPPKHVKGNGGKGTKASQSIMDGALGILDRGGATVVDAAANKGNDIEVSIPRTHRHKKSSPQTRRFFVHKRSNPTGSSKEYEHDFFMKQGEPSDSESSSSETEEKKSEEKE